MRKPFFLLLWVTMALLLSSCLIRPDNPSADGASDYRGIFPPSVRTVGVVMPASVYDKALFDREVGRLRAAGYRVKLAPRLSFDALATPASRAADLADMWTDGEVDLVLCARGGHGVEEIVPHIDWARLRSRPDVPFLGFSDITVLHNAFLKQNVGRPISGPTMSAFARSLPEARDWLSRTLAGRDLPPRRLHALRAGAFSGTSCGGHAHRFAIALRKGYSVSPRGKVVFLESECSIGLELLRETLDYLVDSGSMDGVAGVVFGDMTPGSGSAVKSERALHGEALERARAEVERLKREFAARVTCPVYDGFEYGHVRTNLAVDHLRRLSVDATGLMTWEPSGRKPLADVMDEGWTRVKTVYSVESTKNIYALPPAECEPLSSYANGLMDGSVRYPKGVEDCAIMGGLALSMFVDRFAVTGERRLADEARWAAQGLSNLVFRHRHPGYVSRGLNPADGRSICSLTSRDQVTHLVHGLWRYAKSPLASAEDRTLVSTTLVAVAEWMLRTVTPESDWNFGQADGSADPRGICKMRRTWPHEAARLASVYAAAWDVSGEERYRRALDEVLPEAIEHSERLEAIPRERLLHDGAIPDYALFQMSVSLEVLSGILTDKAVLERFRHLQCVVAQRLAERDEKGVGYCPWLCGAAERPLVQLMAEDFPFSAAAREKLMAEIARVPFEQADSTRIVELSAAYWRLRRRAI